MLRILKEEPGSEWNRRANEKPEEEFCLPPKVLNRMQKRVRAQRKVKRQQCACDKEEGGWVSHISNRRTKKKYEGNEGGM